VVKKNHVLKEKFKTKNMTNIRMERCKGEDIFIKENIARDINTSDFASKTFYSFVARTIA
jgi:hypothetical protein